MPCDGVPLRTFVISGARLSSPIADPARHFPSPPLLFPYPAAACWPRRAGFTVGLADDFAKLARIHKSRIVFIEFYEARYMTTSGISRSRARARAVARDKAEASRALYVRAF